jgi:hypothetical protein
MTPTFEHELESLHELAHQSELEGWGELESESEFESELESELETELESEINPVRKIYADAMMEHLAHMAAEAETEQEAAEHFLPLIGMAAKKLLPLVAKAVSPALRKALPQVARTVTRLEPRLTRGIATIARGLHRQPATRSLLRAVPAIARRTVHSIARQAAGGRPVSPGTAVRTLANQARLVLGRRPHRLQALRRSHLMDRRLHRQMGPGMMRPHGQIGYSGGIVPARYGRVAGPGGICPPCPSCAHKAAPAYCRCCGQILR